MTEHPARLESSLESWKEIAAYLQRDVTTAQRWEKEEGLPVHRHSHKRRSSVYAYASEIDAWRVGRTATSDVGSGDPTYRWPALALTMALCLVMVGNGIRPQTASAAEPANHRLWTLPDGGDIFGSVSRDGRFVPYTHWKQFGNLFVHDLVTGTDRQLTDTGSDGKPGAEVDEYVEETAFSRDGTKLAYSWFRSDHDRYELRVVDLKAPGVPPFRLLLDKEDIDWLSPDDWSPDGKWIAVQLHRKDRTGQIGLVSTADGTLRILKSIDWRGSSRMQFSPDGKLLAFDLPADDSTENHDIFTLAVDGRREIPVVKHPSHDSLLGWSADGKRLVFASDRSGSISVWGQPFSNDRPEGAPELLKRDVGASWWSMGLSDTGALFSATGYSDTLFNIQTAAIDLNTGKLATPPVEAVSTFVGANRYPVWSPDGKYLAYQSTRNGVGLRKFVIGIRSADAGAIREITPSPNFELFTGLQWTPDGKSFLVLGRGAKGIVGVFQVDAQTGRSQLLVENAYIAALMSESRKLYFARRIGSGASFQIALVEKDLVSGNEKELIRKPRLNNFQLSPDGKFITVGVVHSAEIGNRASEILAFPTSGGEPRVLMRADSAQAVAVITWLPDSRSLQMLKVITPQSWERWVVPIDGGAPVRLDPAPVPAAFPRPFRLHPDGKQVAFEVQAPRKPEEVWSLDNFLLAGGN